MLGWEFPPHISGGLGTACQGIARGVRDAGVEVAFVVPRLFGDEPGDVRLLSCTRHLARDPGGPVAAMQQGGAPIPVDGAPVRVQVAPLEADLVEIAVDSPLQPYGGADAYVARTRGVEPLFFDHHARTIVPDVVPDDPPAAPGRPASDPPTWFAGGYGPDLLQEVRRYAEAVARIARDETFEVIHAHDWMTWTAGVLAREVSGRPLVVHVHALEYDRSGEQVDARIHALELAGLHAADRVVCVSQYTAGIVASRYGVDRSRIRVVHNAVDPRAAGVPRDKAIEEPIVLFLGRITFQKGPRYFLEAARRVVDRLPGVKFVMAGSGDMFPHMVEAAAELDLAEHVHFTGFLRGREVERMYAMADVYIMPSVSEPFGIAPLEAMALDVPVIVSNQSGVSEVLTHALKVDFWDVDQLAEQVLSVLTEPGLRRALVEGGREELKQMQWSARGAHLRQVYEEVIG